MNIIFSLILATFSFANLHSEIEKNSPACLIAHQIKISLDHHDKKQIDALIKGIEAQENSLKLTAEEKGVSGLVIEKQRELQAQNNLKASEVWLKEKSDDEIQVIVPKKLLYLTIKEGDGKKLNNHYGNVKINYVIKKFNHEFPEASAEKKTCDLSQMIPGFIYGMASMQEGEIRKMYIHPSLAYGYSNTFEPNIALEVTVELLNILSLQGEIPPLKEINPLPELEATQKQVDELLLKNSYVIGWELWNHLKFGHSFFTKEQLIDCLTKDIEPSLSKLEFDKKINSLHWLIYRQRIKDEYNDSDVYFDKLAHQADMKCIVPGLLYCQCKTSLNQNRIDKKMFKITLTVKDKSGEILKRERTEILNINSSIKGLKEGLPYLPIGELVTLYIHPTFGFVDSDFPFGDKLLIIDIVLESSF